MARIVIASQDVGVLAILTAEVEAEGHEVIEAMNGQDALDAATTRDVDFLFLDLALPIFNGIETCQLLRSDPTLPPNLPIILVTDEDVAPRTRERAHVTTILSKTHHVHEVRDLLARHLGANARG